MAFAYKPKPENTICAIAANETEAEKMGINSGTLVLFDKVDITDTVFNQIRLGDKLCSAMSDSDLTLIDNWEDYIQSADQASELREQEIKQINNWINANKGNSRANDFITYISDYQALDLGSSWPIDVSWGRHIESLGLTYKHRLQFPIY